MLCSFLPSPLRVHGVDHFKRAQVEHSSLAPKDSICLRTKAGARNSQLGISLEVSNAGDSLSIWPDRHFRLRPHFRRLTLKTLSCLNYASRGSAEMLTVSVSQESPCCEWSAEMLTRITEKGERAQIPAGKQEIEHSTRLDTAKWPDWAWRSVAIRHIGQVRAPSVNPAICVS
jgi:hypothetical protein